MIHSVSRNRNRAFTLVEMLVVIVIMSILMTVGSIGISSIGGKGVTSGVTAVEALFDEARTTAVSRGLRSCVLVAKTLTSNTQDDLRRVMIAYEETNTDGTPKAPTSTAPQWVLSSRGIVLPDQTFFSETFSKTVSETGTYVAVPEIKHSRLVSPKAAQQGIYFIYEFNSQGISSSPGAKFVVGSGSRKLSAKSTDAAGKPKVTASGKLDFGGFMVMRNGRTSVFRSPDQMGIPSTVTNF